jgi:predicted transcriptional regulator
LSVLNFKKGKALYFNDLNFLNKRRVDCAVNVKEFIDRFNLHVAAGKDAIDRQITGGYCGDLLSDVMANAPAGCIWFTVQTHQNIVNVAVLHEMAAIVLTGGQTPDQETIDRANQEGIPLLLWPHSAYDLAGQAFAAGLVSKAG